ncbi:MAG: hypothetical protein IPP14_07255 [Planctomycetes bacterium]|nr:hypothetical protein [Planctomycetota bacterium]
MKPASIALLSVFLLLSGCGFGAAVDSGRAAGDRFLELMAKGDYQQARELCSGLEFSEEALKAFATDPGNAAMLKDYKGIDWASGGQLETVDGQSTLRLPRSELKGKPGTTVVFSFQQQGNDWRIVGFALKSGK